MRGGLEDIAHFGLEVVEVAHLALEAVGAELVVVLLHEFCLSGLLSHECFDEVDLLVEDSHFAVPALDELNLLDELQ